MFKVGDRVKVTFDLYKGKEYIVESAKNSCCLIVSCEGAIIMPNEQLTLVPNLERIEIIIHGITNTVRVTHTLNGEKSIMPPMEFGANCKIDICAESIESITCTETTEKPKPEPPKPPVPEFTIEGFKAGKFAINCRTEAEAKRFLLYLHGMGIEWLTGSFSYSNLMWDWFKADTCYSIEHGGVVFGSREHPGADYVLPMPDIIPKFDLNAFKAGALAVSCVTQEHAKYFVEHLSKNGIEPDRIALWSIAYWGDRNFPITFEVNDCGEVACWIGRKTTTIPFNADEL